ncbi:MAG: hypothetical protein J5I93_03790 [Pirellulaceae bacterium]|nr:hypothetical protein [Pirellulaceae bacterium]
MAIITTNPRQTNNSDGTTTFSFTVREMNAGWDEVVSSSSRTYKLGKPDSTGKRKIITGIGTNARSTWVATGYYR